MVQIQSPPPPPQRPGPPPAPFSPGVAEVTGSLGSGREAESRRRAARTRAGEGNQGKGSRRTRRAGLPLEASFSSLGLVTFPLVDPSLPDKVGPGDRSPRQVGRLGRVLRTAGRHRELPCCGSGQNPLFPSVATAAFPLSLHPHLLGARPLPRSRSPSKEPSGPGEPPIHLLCCCQSHRLTRSSDFLRRPFKQTPRWFPPASLVLLLDTPLSHSLGSPVLELVTGFPDVSQFISDCSAFCFCIPVFILLPWPLQRACPFSS